MADLDDLDNFDSFGDIDQISFDDPPVAPPAPGAPAAPMGAAPAGGPALPPKPSSGLGAVIYDLISKQNYQQVLQVAESQKDAIAQDPQVQQLVEIARSQLSGAAPPMADTNPLMQAAPAAPTAPAAPMAPSAPAAPMAPAAAPAAPGGDMLSMDDSMPLTLGGDAMGGSDLQIDPIGTDSALPDLAPIEPAMPAPGMAPDAMAAPGMPPQQPGFPPPDPNMMAQPGMAPQQPGFPPPDPNMMAPPGMPPQQPGFPPPDPNMMAPPGMPPQQPGFPPPDPNMMAPPGMPPQQPGFPPPDPNMMAQPGMAPQQPGFPPPDPNMMAQPGMAPQQPGFPPPDPNMMAQPGMAPPQAGAGFDAAMPSDFAPMGPPPGPGEGGERIQQLLDEGQNLFNQGDYQNAIDVWSRIFLIDIDHQEASQRIEEARSKKAELERQAEEIFHSALDQIEQERLEDAKNTLRQVLQMQPTHTTAQEYLDQLEAGQVPVFNRFDSGTGSQIDLLDDGGLGSFDSATTGEDGQSLDAAVARDRVVVVKKTDRKLIGLAAGVGLLVLAGGGFLAMKWDDLFPNTENQTAAAPQSQIDPIARATKMYEAGNIENAVLILEKLPSADPSYEKAQALAAQWKAEIETPVDQQETGPSEEMMNRRTLLLRAAREAHTQQRMIRARKYFDRANKILPLESSDLALKRDCDLKLDDLKAEIAGFGAGEYEEILPSLWRMLDETPENLDIQHLIIDSYYNLALKDLQRSNPSQAAQKLADVLDLAPDNDELQRMHLFAKTYQNKSPDLLYRIYVKYLPSRS